MWRSSITSMSPVSVTTMSAILAASTIGITR
jgi:hypothetical protein